MSIRLYLIFLCNLTAIICSGKSASEIDSVATPIQLQRYVFQIETKKGGVSGILLANYNGDIINGSMMNEFAVSAVDFNYSIPKEKIKLIRVISFLNRWYIKRVLAGDLTYCLHELYGIPYKKRHSYLVEHQGNALSITNKKHNINYIFTPLDIITDNYEAE